MPEMKSNHQEMNHLLKAVDNELSAGRAKGDPTEARLRVSLDDKDREWATKEDQYSEEMLNIQILTHQQSDALAGSEQMRQ